MNPQSVTAVRRASAASLLEEAPPSTKALAKASSGPRPGLPELPLVTEAMGIHPSWPAYTIHHSHTKASRHVAALAGCTGAAGHKFRAKAATSRQPGEPRRRGPKHLTAACPCLLGHLPSSTVISKRLHQAAGCDQAIGPEVASFSSQQVILGQALVGACTLFGIHYAQLQLIAVCGFHWHQHTLRQANTSELPHPGSKSGTVPVPLKQARLNQALHCEGAPRGAPCSGSFWYHCRFPDQSEGNQPIGPAITTFAEGNSPLSPDSTNNGFDHEVS